MTMKLAAKVAFQIINDRLLKDFNLFPLDGKTRTKAHGFAVGGEHGKQFVLILGNSDEGAKQTRIITEKISGPPVIAGVEYLPEIYKGARVNQDTTNLKYRNRLRNENQSSFLVSTPSALEELLYWYVNGTLKDSLDKHHLPEIGSSDSLSKTGRKDHKPDDKSCCDDILEITGKCDEPTTREQLIQARLGQGKFKEDVIKVWGLGKRCAVTNVNIEELLIASHIIPWSESEELRLEGANGILLCVHLDKLFDRYLISFDEEGQLIPSNRLTSTDWERLREIGVDQSLCLNMGQLNEQDKVGVRKHLEVHRQRLANKDQASANEH
jgi:predicted restriction endonuclease